MPWNGSSAKSARLDSASHPRRPQVHPIIFVPRARGTNMIGWTWGLRGCDALSSRADFAEDPFQGMAMTDSSYGHSPLGKIKAGEEATLLVVRGNRDKLEGQAWDSKTAGHADVEMRLKARFDKVPENELRETSQSTNSVRPATTGAKSR